MKRLIAVVYIVLCANWLTAQEAERLFLPGTTPPEAAELLKKYLSTTDNAEAKVKELLTLVEQDLKFYDDISAINKLQVALLLEDYIAPNSLTTLDLNRQMGVIATRINKRYALYFLKRAVNICYHLKDAKASNRREMMGMIAGLHTNLNEPDSALYWYRKSLAETKDLNAVSHASSLNNIGFFYSKTNQPDSAMAYYEDALTTLGGIQPDTILYCSIRDNIAQEREKRKDYAFALEVYQFNDQIFTEKKRPNRIVPNRIRLLRSKFHVDGSDIAPEIERLAAYVKQNDNELKEQNILDFLQFAKDYFLEIDQIDKAKHFDRLYIAEVTAIQKKNNEKADRIGQAFLNVQATRFTRDLEVYRLKEEKSRQAAQYNRLLALSIILISGLVIGLLVLFFQKRRRELENNRRLAVAELQAKELEAIAMQQELELKKRDLTNVVLQNTQLFDHDQTIISRLNDTIRQKGNMEKSIHLLIADLNAKHQTGDRALVIQTNIDKINSAFYENLKSQFPGLTKSEIELCGYLRINLSNKDIALLKNVAYTSIKVSKTRLRKKLGISLEADIYQFIQGI